MTQEASNAAERRFCMARSAMTDTGLYRCTLPEGHDGPHKSATATWPATAAWTKADFVPIRYDGPPISFRSMGWLERKLRLFAGSGWNGEHQTGYGWARALLTVGERLWWK